MNQVAGRQSNEGALVRELPLANRTNRQLGDQEAARLAAHVLLLLLKILREVKSFEDLRLPLLLQLVVERVFQELLQPQDRNVVGQDLKNPNLIKISCASSKLLTASAE